LLSVAEKMSSWLMGADRVLLVGLGNENRGDDGAGVLVAREMEVRASSRFIVMNLGEAVGRLLPDATDFMPSHIIIVDAAAFNDQPGSVRLMDLNHIEAIHSSSTHDLSISVAVGLVTSGTHSKSIAVGIQPRAICVGCEMSAEVKIACGQVVTLLEEQLSKAHVI